MSEGGERPKVYYTHWVPPEGPAMLEPSCHVIRHRLQRPPMAAEIVARADEAFGLCVSVRDRIDEDILKHCPHLKVISSFARGADNIDVQASTDCGIFVVTVSEVLAEPTADMTWALLMALARRIVPSDRFVRSGRFRGWEPNPAFSGANVFGATLGVIGMGQLGRALARRARGFSMHITYWQPHRLAPADEQTLGVAWVARADLLARSDFVCICSPLTSSTRQQIGQEELDLMKPSALLINTSRGSEVDESAVAQAIAAGCLGGYAADVFAMEDCIAGQSPCGIPESLLGVRDRTVFTPHASTAIAEVRVRIARAQAQAILDVLRGRRPPGAVNSPG